MQKAVKYDFNSFFYDFKLFLGFMNPQYSFIGNRFGNYKF